MSARFTETACTPAVAKSSWRKRSGSWAPPDASSARDAILAATTLCMSQFRAEIRDGRHENEYLGHHHEGDGQEQKLRGQADGEFRQGSR